MSDNPEKDLNNFDPHCLHVKKHIPEIKNVECSVIHSGQAYLQCDYVSPIVDIKESFVKFKDTVKSIN